LVDNCFGLLEETFVEGAGFEGAFALDLGDNFIFCCHRNGGVLCGDSEVSLERWCFGNRELARRHTRRLGKHEILLFATVSLA